MSERIINERLKELYDNNVPVYSITRLDTINNCMYEAYRTYVKHEKGLQNVYALLGGKIHDVLEAIVNNAATKEDLLPAMNAELENLEMMNLEFPKDNKGGDAIRDGWIKNMTHFCNTYEAPSGEFETEQFFLYKTPKGRYLQGYIDLLQKNADGTISIFDYKTSSLYKGGDIKEHGRQLVTYAMAKEQEGYKVDKVAWIFLKYVNITYEGYKTCKSKNKSQITKIGVERKKISSEMYAAVERDLLEKYDELDTNFYLMEFSRTNDFSALPEEVASNYKIEPCIYYYDLTDEVKEECENYIDDTIDKWESMQGLDEFEFKPREFERVNKLGNVVPDYFYCCQLCNYRTDCVWLKQYLDNNIKEDDSMFD